MYSFILNLWIMRRVGADKVNSYISKWLTADQANTILNTPQIPESEV